MALTPKQRKQFDRHLSEKAELAGAKRRICDGQDAARMELEQSRIAGLRRDHRAKFESELTKLEAMADPEAEFEAPRVSELRRLLRQQGGTVLAPADVARLERQIRVGDQDRIKIDQQLDLIDRKVHLLFVEAGIG